MSLIIFHPLLLLVNPPFQIGGEGFKIVASKKPVFRRKERPAFFPESHRKVGGASSDIERRIEWTWFYVALLSRSRVSYPRLLFLDRISSR